MQASDFPSLVRTSLNAEIDTHLCTDLLTWFQTEMIM